MRVKKVGDLYQLTFMPRFFPVSCYLLERKDELVLIDAALPYSTKAILQTAAKIGKPITNLILTHAHSDHIGALDDLKAAIPGLNVSISARDSLLLKGDASLQPGEPDSPIRGGVPKKIKTKPDFLLEEGDRIGSLEVIFTPGHTPGSISLYDVHSQFLIAGDAFHTRGGMAVSGTLKLLFPFPALATWNKQSALESAVKLRNLHPKLLAVGHGRMVADPLEAMDKAIWKGEKKLESVKTLE
ncbi:MBL fold metallo-hydrolase [Planococcus salinus]|uniref:MBL fold metallo-hydrolase n=1 Tax=Planococcus salinus TaxID=1848460 RepID=A0A3M8P789_9BACL|nr:MBL fold metallo-hydrolase [Planococcus salinus]RNF39536.1 MBL fold metallo-hydrolase [Planococcus salinus]